MRPIIPKAFIYVTRGADHLLLLSHPLHPEAGLQVPAGTILPGEEPEHAARRELTEETGLRCFQIKALLGERFYDMRPFGKEQVHHRYFYHAVLTGEAPERWRHYEGNAGPDLIPLEFFWWGLKNGLPDLIAGHGSMIDRLLRA